METTLRPASIATGRFDHHFHACAFFRSQEEEHRIMAPFIAEGLSWGEKAVYIVDPKLKDEHFGHFKKYGVDASHNPDQLGLLTWTETYLRDGKFDKDQMLEVLAVAIHDAYKGGYPRARLMGQMGWALLGLPGTDRLLEYEIGVNDILLKYKTPGVCMYDVNKLTGDLMMDLLRVHPMTIVGGAIYENPFYVPAEQMLEELRGRKQALTH